MSETDSNGVPFEAGREPLVAAPVRVEADPTPISVELIPATVVTVAWQGDTLPFTGGTDVPMTPVVGMILVGIALGRVARWMQSR